MKKMDVVYLNDVERYAEVLYNEDNKVMGLVYTGPDYSLNDYYDEDIIEVLNYDKIEEGVQVIIDYEEGKEFVLPVPTLEGYKFLGWSKEEGSTNYIEKLVEDGEISLIGKDVDDTADALYACAISERFNQE